MPLSRRTRGPAALAAALALAALALEADATTPQLGLVHPRGGQRGTKKEIQLYGQRLKEARAVLCQSPGLSFGPLKIVNDRVVSVPISIAPEARIGEHSLRLVTATGLTELRTFWVDELPQLSEKEPNNQAEQAQVVPLDHIITGRLPAEDTDRFAFEAKKGQRLTAEVLGMRLGSAMFDPVLTLTAPDGAVIAEVDDRAESAQDPYISLIIPEDGRYVLALRGAAYAGNNSCFYRMALGGMPRPRLPYPLGGPPGSTQRIDFLGDVAGTTSATLVLDPAPTRGQGLYYRDAHGRSPAPLPFAFSPIPNLLEAEPNNNPKQARAQAPAIDHEGAINGRFDKPGDIDFWPFRARKARRYDIRSVSRALGSDVDTVVTIHQENGRYLVGNDDRGGPDSALGWQAPKDGLYWIRVRDHLRRSGPTAIYRIEVTESRPTLALRVPKFARYGQYRQAHPVPRGNRMATIIEAQRGNFRGEVALIASGLPAGVRAAFPKMSVATNRVPVVFEAAPDAPLSQALVRVEGAWKPAKGPGVTGGLSQDADLVYGFPNNRLYYKRTEGVTALAVTQAAPFSIRLVRPAAPIVKDGSGFLEVEVLRAAGAEKMDIRLSVLHNPPGVSSQRNVQAPRGRARALARLSVNANNRAAVGRWPIVVIATTRIAGGELNVASQIEELGVEDPYLSLSFKRCAGEQGAEVTALCQVTLREGFAGEAVVQLQGLPRGCSAAPQTIKAGLSELRFKIKVGDKTRPSRYRNIRALVTCRKEGRPVLHRTGVLELRVDRPLPGASDASKSKAKGLSRLERLRRDHAELVKRRQAAEKGSP